MCSSARVYCPRPEPCPVSPPLPDQGGIMPVLWQPSVQTLLNSTCGGSSGSDATYTLNVVATQRIARGILLRFQMWQGTQVYGATDTATAEFDLILKKDIPAGTTCIVKMTSTATGIYAFSGSSVYASGGRGIPSTYFVTGSSLICFAFAPTATNRWLPARGQPMFAIGFSNPQTEGEVLSELPAFYTAPNFPDQWSGNPVFWTFHFQVVFPAITLSPLTVCNSGLGADAPALHVVQGIKVRGIRPIYATGSWSNLRDQIAQPWVVVKDNHFTASRWLPYLAAAASETNAGLVGSLSTRLDETTADTGPFVLAAMPGQLAVVYFKPRYKAISAPDDNDPISDNGQPWPYNTTEAAEAAFLVTSPLQPQQALYFSVEGYNAGIGGFGPRYGAAELASFVKYDPSFVWTTGCKVIPAGTVILITEIGHATDPISIRNAHDVHDDVGVISRASINGTDTGSAVVSLIVTSQWAQVELAAERPWTAEMFVTAVLSEQYSGDLPPLSPMLTMPRSRMSGIVIYGRKKVFDNTGLPGLVQAALINSAVFASVEADDAPVQSRDLPAFRNMETFRW